MITHEQLFELHSDLCTRGLAIMKKKNADYGANDDPFANFRMSALVKVEPAKGILLRIQDKMARMVSFIEKGELKVKDESVEDSIIDAINYLVLLRGLLKSDMKFPEN